MIAIRHANRTLCSLAAAVCLLDSTGSGTELPEALVPYRDHAVGHTGDAVNGEKLFLSHKDLQCTNCHRVVGMELQGPNLDGIGDKFSREELIRQILVPSESIKPGFEQARLLTVDGSLIVGRIERATRLSYRIIDGNGKQRNISVDDVEQFETSGVSMMPQDLVRSITPEQFTDLIAYLETLRYGVKHGYVAGGEEIPIPQTANPVQFVPIHPESLAFENPVWCGTLPGTESDLLVAEHQTGKLWRLIGRGEEARKELFLDLSGDIAFSGNQGLMCVAFHPDFVENGRYFIKHEVSEGGEIKTTVVERSASEDRLSDSGKPSRRLLEIAQPAFNHNGGCLDFGPDGMLYIGFGDGGPQKDPPGYSQNPRIFHGSMLRINVDGRTGELPYAIPPDNPFLEAAEDDPAIRAETWAIGFREPWRFSFDPETGELYVGDVGQNAFEEVCLVRRGENHGWNVREGFEPFSEEYRREGETYVEPLFAYPHGLGFSVTGGHVYRGRRNPSLVGVYIFGDYNTRRVWGLRQREGVVEQVAEIGSAPGGIASFAVDQQGEILMLTYAGTIYHVELAGVEFPSPRP